MFHDNSFLGGNLRIRKINYKGKLKLLLSTFIFPFSANSAISCVIFKHKELSEKKPDVHQTIFDKQKCRKAYMEYRTNAIADNQFFASGNASLIALPGIVKAMFIWKYPFENENISALDIVLFRRIYRCTCFLRQYAG